MLDSVGPTTAVTIGFSNHVVGPAGDAGGVQRWARPVAQFPTSDFSSIIGLPLVSATLRYNIVSDFFEPADTGTSEVRLFTTNETILEMANRDVYAGLSGDGGAHTPIGSVNFVDGMVGPQSLAFSPAGLTALFGAINGPDATIAIAFREFIVTGFGVDSLDEFVLGIPPGNMTIDITALPEPATLTLLALGSLAVLRRRRK